MPRKDQARQIATMRKDLATPSKAAELSDAQVTPVT
jgi:hypothetical protein